MSNDESHAVGQSAGITCYASSQLSQIDTHTVQPSSELDALLGEILFADRLVGTFYSFSSDDAAAMKIVKELHRWKMGVCIHTPGFIYDYESGMYQCEISTKGKHALGKAESLALAVCCAVIDYFQRNQEA